MPALPTDDLSDVVPSAKFWAEFPDGRIPIRHTAHLIWRNPDNHDVYQALQDTLTAYDQTRTVLRSMSASDVLAKIDEFMLTPVSHAAERQAILHALALDGLAIRTILNLIPDTWERRKRALATMLSNKPSTLTDAYVDQVLAADDLLLAGEPREVVLRRTGIKPNTLRCIQRFRTAALVGYEGALRWAFHQMMRGERTADVVRRMHVEFPEVAALIPTHTVYALLRPHRIERNKQRFGWIDEVTA